MAKGADHNDDDDAKLEQEYKRLGERIRAIRVALGYSSSERFANEKGLSRAQYAKYEKGKNLQYANLLKVTKALDISLKDFFAEGFDQQ